MDPNEINIIEDEFVCGFCYKMCTTQLLCFIILSLSLNWWINIYNISIMLAIAAILGLALVNGATRTFTPQVTNFVLSQKNLSTHNTKITKTMQPMYLVNVNYT